MVKREVEGGELVSVLPASEGSAQAGKVLGHVTVLRALCQVTDRKGTVYSSFIRRFFLTKLELSVFPGSPFLFHFPKSDTNVF